MNEGKEKNSFGILKSLKKLIFEDHSEQQTSPQEQPVANVPPEKPAVAASQSFSYSQSSTADSPAPLDVKQMKLKVLEILEKLNEPGIDFFEVWNAAAEMGTVDATTLKAAFTSLKYVDKSLSKEKLQRSGQHYADELQKVINRETSQKQQQKQNLEQSLVKEKTSLGEEIVQLEKKLEELKQQLQSKQQDLQGINSKYEPQLRDIDNKIAIGNSAVTEVLSDIKQALHLIETSI